MSSSPKFALRNWMAYLGFCYALLDDFDRSERIRRIVRQMDRRTRFRLDSLN